MMTERNEFPFTESQWKELQHQALIYKYILNGMPIPPDLLFSLKRSIDCPLSSKLLSHQTPHIGWNCFQMGLGRKIDPEPGRCRRTDGKKWRCSKEAFADSKYCEKHMHRGKNRSRKPVEIMTTPSPTTATISYANNNNPSKPHHILSSSSVTKSQSLGTPSNLSTPPYSLSSFNSDTYHHHHHPFYNNTHLHHYLQSPSSKPPHGSALSHQENNTPHLLLDSGSYSQTDPDYRYLHGLKAGVDEHAFFSETSGTMRSFSGSSMEESWQLAPLAMNNSSSMSKQKGCSYSDNDYSDLQLQSFPDTSKRDEQDRQQYYDLGRDMKYKMPVKNEKDNEPQKTVYHFFDEGPKENKDSWLNLDDKSSRFSSLSTTQLSMSIPNSSHIFPIFNSRTRND